MEKLKQEIEAQRKDGESTLQREKELSAQVENLKKESKALKEASERADALEAFSQELEGQLNTEKEAHKVTLTNLKNLESEVSLKDDEITELKNENNSIGMNSGLQKEATDTVTNRGSKSKKKKKKSKNASTLSNGQIEKQSAVGEKTATAQGEDNGVLHAEEDLDKTKKKLEELQTKYDDLIAKQTLVGEEDSKMCEIKEELESLKIENTSLLHELQEMKKDLKFKAEEVDNVRDILKSVGNELVDAKETLKNYDSANTTEITELKSRLEKLQSETSIEVKRYEDVQAELKKRITSLEKEITESRQETDSLKTSLRKSDQDKNKLLAELKKSEETIGNFRKDNNSLSDQLREFNVLKRSDASMKMSLNQKEKTITYLEQQIKEYSSKEEAGARTLREVKAENSKILNRVSQLTKENEELKNEVKKADNSLEKYIKENGSLSERLLVLKEKYETLQDMKSNSSDQVELIRRQCEELNIKLKEANKRHLSLEDELSEVAATLQERTQEASSMRRLLSERQTDRDILIQNLEEKLKATTDDKNRLENDLALHVSKMNRSMSEVKEVNDELRSQVTILRTKEENQRLEVARLMSLNADMQKNKSESSHSSEELKEALFNVRRALLVSEKKVRELEFANENLRDLNNELNKKLERLSKNYKLLSNQLAVSKERAESRTSSRSNSVVSVPDHAANEPMSRCGSFRKESTSEKQSEINDRIAYIKNVLLGFLERRDQRDQLLPVVSTLLQLDSNDEKRLMAIR